MSLHADRGMPGSQQSWPAFSVVWYSDLACLLFSGSKEIGKCIRDAGDGVCITQARLWKGEVPPYPGTALP